jgi:hypothetical protein
MKAETTIRIGPHAECESVHERAGYPVFRKTIARTDSYIIGQTPKKVRASEPRRLPACCEKYDDRIKALSTLDQCANSDFPIRR